MTKLRGRPIYKFPFKRTRRCALIAAASVLVIASGNDASTAPSVAPEVAVAGGLAGRNIERVEVRGNQSVPTQTILNVVRSRVGEPLDPLTVQEDYQRIYGLKKFSNVLAKLEPTEAGVNVVFIVTEQKTIRAIGFRGNDSGHVTTQTLSELVDLRPGQAIDNSRIRLARHQIEQLYRAKNYPFATVSIDSEALSENGDVVFVISEGQNVRIRNIDFIGAESFSEGELKKKIQSKIWIWVVRPGTLVEDQLDDDVALLRQFYQNKGFFDVRVGRRVLFSPDQKSAQVEFLIDEGQRYKIEKIVFTGNSMRSEDQLREGLKLVEGAPFDQELVERDRRKMVDLYADTGMIYAPGSADPGYLDIRVERRFQLEPGAIELVYNIHEGKPFTVGNIEIRGNERTQQKVLLRDFRLEPGKLYNATEARRGEDRLKSLGFFDRVQVTPIGDKETERDILIEVEEARTATLMFGGGINSNGGLSANLTYTQKNFDIMRWPNNIRDILNQNALVGAGQQFRLSIEPGTELTQASVSWRDPWFLDQPYSLGVDGYIKDRRRDSYREGRAGGRLTLGKRWSDVYSGSLSLRGEDVEIYNIGDKPVRAFEILDAGGHTTITSLAATLRRDTTNLGMIAYEGTTTSLTWESYGLLGGDNFQKFSASFDWYNTLATDLLDRKTVLALRADAGFIADDAPFFERFYGGGIGSIRGFRFRGVSPREGPDDDAIGGEFQLVGTAELSFPIYSDNLRAVVFADAGTVEEDVTFGTIRSSAGFGIRLTLPVMGQIPIAIDYAVPITRDDMDEEQRISFSLGIIP